MAFNGRVNFKILWCTLNSNFEDIPGWLTHISIWLIWYAKENFPLSSFWGNYLAARLRILFNITSWPTLAINESLRNYFRDAFSVWTRTVLSYLSWLRLQVCHWLRLFKVGRISLINTNLNLVCKSNWDAYQHKDSFVNWFISTFSMH